MPRPGVPAVGPMSIRTRATVPSVRRRNIEEHTGGPEQRWQTEIGPPFLYTSANWGGQSFYLEAYMRSTSGKAMARLYDSTTATEVSGSTLTVDGATTTHTRNRTAALTLVDGHEYRIQLGRQDGGAGALLGAKLVII